MAFNHSKLRGRIKELGLTQEAVAKQIDMNPCTLSMKLKNKSHFTADEMNRICRMLDISPEEIGAYFFAK